MGIKIGITPRKASDRGGIACLYLDKNVGWKIKQEHPDWELINCPKCGQRCWKRPEVDELVKSQGISYLCTECALKIGAGRL